jgi:hypothetical protein
MIDVRPRREWMRQRRLGGPICLRIANPSWHGQRHGASWRMGQGVCNHSKVNDTAVLRRQRDIALTRGS